TAQLRRDLELRATESQRLAVALDAQTQEMNRLRDEIGGILRDLEKSGGNGTHTAEGVLPPGATAATPAPQAAPAAESPPRAAETARDDEIERLRTAIERLDARVRELEPAARPVRRTFRELLVHLA